MFERRRRERQVDAFTRARETSDPSALAALATNEYYLARMAVAENPATPVATLARLSEDPHVFVRTAIAENPATPVASLVRLAEDPEITVRKNVAAHPSTPESCLGRMAQEAEGLVISALIRNQRTPEDLLMDLAVRGLERDRTYRHWLDTVAVHFGGPAYREVDRHRDAAARALLHNPRTPASVLCMMAEEPGFPLKGEVAEHLNAPKDLQDALILDWSPTRAYAAAVDQNSSQAILAELMKHKDSLVRAAVAQHPLTPVANLVRLSTDQSANVRNAVASHPATPADVRLKLALDHDQSVRRGAASHASAPYESRLASTAGDGFDSFAEQVFWLAHLDARAPSLDGLKPQVAVGRYRVDFGLPARKIAIEVDGLAYHSDQAAFVNDRSRQRQLELDGWRVLRFAAKEVLDDPHRCIDEAAQWVQRV